MILTKEERRFKARQRATGSYNQVLFPAFYGEALGVDIRWRLYAFKDLFLRGFVIKRREEIENKDSDVEKSVWIQ